MKKVLIIAMAFVIGQHLSAQMHVATNLRQDYNWSISQDKWMFESEDDQSSTLIDFNKELTMFTYYCNHFFQLLYTKQQQR